MACLICDCRTEELIYIIKNYNIHKCDECGFEFVKGVKEDDLKYYYELDYFNGMIANYKSGKFEDPVAEEKLWILNKRVCLDSCSKILEIGPSIDGGIIKHFMSDKSKTLKCIDVSLTAATDLNNKGLSTDCGYIYNNNITDKFDLCIATEVIEHELDPIRFVQSIRDLLRTDGYLFLTTGNTSSFYAGLFGAGWYYRDPPAHLHYFNSKNIAQLLTKCGYKDVKVINAGFETIKLLLRFKMMFLLPVISKLNLMTGMIVTARKG